MTSWLIFSGKQRTTYQKQIECQNTDFKGRVLFLEGGHKTVRIKGYPAQGPFLPEPWKRLSFGIWGTCFLKRKKKKESFFFFILSDCYFSWKSHCAAQWTVNSWTQAILLPRPTSAEVIGMYN